MDTRDKKSQTLFYCLLLLRLTENFWTPTHPDIPAASLSWPTCTISPTSLPRHLIRVYFAQGGLWLLCFTSSRRHYLSECMGDGGGSGIMCGIRPAYILAFRIYSRFWCDDDGHSDDGILGYCFAWKMAISSTDLRLSFCFAPRPPDRPTKKEEKWRWHEKSVNAKSRYGRLKAYRPFRIAHK